jgi:ATP-dependent helicase/nuclease subunit A
LNDFKTIQFFDNYYDILLNLFKFSEIIYNKIEEFKKENSVITYNDMLWKTYKILQNNEITNKIREKYDYILVDEFQDTDNVQYDILTKLVPSLKRINHKSKLFVVGDPKQSIYGFRNADVRVIKSTETDITSINSELIEKNELTLNAIIKMINHEEKSIDLKDTEARGKIELKISHRLNIVNTAFINHIFSRLMQFSDFDYSVTYNPFIYARKTPNIDNLLNLNEIEFNNEDYSNGMVNFLISIITNKKDEEDTEFNNNANNNEKSDVNNSDQDEEDDESEAMLTVNYIKYLLNNDKKIWDSKLNVYRKIQINDIAILIRKRSNIKNLTNLLNKEKIPYFLNESDNFFDNQEIIDIINYLRFLYNKNDDLAFSALLKSNFFGLLDDEIYEIRNFDENQSLWNSLNLFNASNEKYEKILEDINKLLFKYQNLTIKELVNEIIEESNYLSTYLKNPLFNVIQNNIYNLKIYINKLFDKGINNLSDLLKEIDKSIKYSNFDNAMISTDANSLNILTIHKSKGLEFPVVILYNTNSKTPNLGNILFHENFGLNFDFLLKNEDGETVNVKMPSLNLCKQYLSKKDDEESKRLLYVALTRAKDILTITSSIKRKVNSNEEKYSKASGLFKLILNAFDLDVNNFVNNAINQNFEFEEPVEIYAENLTNTIKVKAKLPVYTSFKSSTLNISSTVKNEIEENDYLLIDEIIQKEPVNKFSATKLQAFIHKPIEFVEKYLFQYPKIFFEEEKFTPSGKLLTAADRGTIIHNIMMNIKNWYSSTKYINYNYLNEIIKKYQNSQNILINDNDKELIINEITMVVNSHFIQTNLHYLLDAKFEYELNVPLFNNLFKVIYDVLILNKDEEYEIWDWKSNKILNNEDIQLKAKYYELQMKIYALVLTYLYPNNNKYIAKLIFTNYVVNSKEDFDWIVTFEWSKSELKDFEKEISNLIHKTSDVEIIQKYLNDI